MLETQMSRIVALHDNLFKIYLLQHCLSWYKFARDIGIQVNFGDIMLVTECSKTAAWASAVYSQSSKEFDMLFSTGGAFLPSVALSVGNDRVGPVEHRRSQRRANSLVDGQELRKDHTVFIKAFYLGSRSLYLRSLAHKIMQTKSRERQDDRNRSVSQASSMPQANEPSIAHASASPSSGSSDSFEGVQTLTPEWPVSHAAPKTRSH
jgi:hypothetical protein